MGRPEISIYRVLDQVVKEMEMSGKWDEIVGTEGQAKLTFLDFKVILITDEITTSERKIKELWKQIGELGLGRRVNQSQTYIIDLPTFCKFMSRKYERYSGPRRAIA